MIRVWLHNLDVFCFNFLTLDKIQTCTDVYFFALPVQIPEGLSCDLF